MILKDAPREIKKIVPSGNQNLGGGLWPFTGKKSAARQKISSLEADLAETKSQLARCGEDFDKYTGHLREADKKFAECQEEAALAYAEEEELAAALRKKDEEFTEYRKKVEQQDEEFKSTVKSFVDREKAAKDKYLQNLNDTVQALKDCNNERSLQDHTSQPVVVHGTDTDYNEH